MSNLAMSILYEVINSQPGVLAERVFAPWIDMEASLRKNNIPLFSLETKHPIKDFDIIGFSLGYELNYTNVLNILDLGQIPVSTTQRGDKYPLVIAGGSCTSNPEPMANFIDLFVIGDGEEIILELLEIAREHQHERQKLLQQSAMVPGVYIPSLYRVDYGSGRTAPSLSPLIPEAKAKITRRIVAKLPPPVTSPIVPYINVIHDRGVIEIQRGCTQGCRFCQAGSIYRPVRERPPEEITTAVDELSQHCGYREMSLLSLSSGDHSHIAEIIATLAHRYHNDNLSLSLPSLRLDADAAHLLDLLPPQRKTSLTFAPEAGSDRLRRVIYKNISEEQVLQTLDAVLKKGWTKIKLYFMVGLPSETMDDIDGIVYLIDKIRRLHGRIRLQVGASILIPKPHTPCQWVAQETSDTLHSKYGILIKELHRRRVNFSWADPHVSQIEAALSRGDRRIGEVIYHAWKSGCRFDAWHELFNYDKWLEAFEHAGLPPSLYANREVALDEPLPWSHIDTGITPSFLKREYHRMWQEEETPDCKFGTCNICGLQQWHDSCHKKYLNRIQTRGGIYPSEPLP